MATLQIRHVPDDVQRLLTNRARAQGQSLQEFLLTLVIKEAGRANNLALLERFDGRDDGWRATPEQATVGLERTF